MQAVETGIDFAQSRVLQEHEKKRFGPILSEMFDKQLAGLMNDDMAMFNKVLKWPPFQQFMKHRGTVCIIYRYYSV